MFKDVCVYVCVSNGLNIPNVITFKALLNLSYSRTFLNWNHYQNRAVIIGYNGTEMIIMDVK